MTKRARATRKSTAAGFMASAVPLQAPHLSRSESPNQFEFDLRSFTNSTCKKKTKVEASSSVLVQPTMLGSSPCKAITTISDLKDLMSSRLESIKRHLDRSHAEIVRDVEASCSRLSKRFKIQSQACQQVMDETEKEYKKTSERISESREAMKASYAEIIAEAQNSASRVCRTSIIELSQSFEKSIDVLRSRYGISSASE